MKTQEQVVRQLLNERAKAGVTARELIYDHGITRAAAIIFDLRHPRDGSEPMRILTLDDGPLDDGRRRTARYVLATAKPSPRPAPPPVSVWDNPPQPPAILAPVPLPCGCVRSADGRSWDQRCEKHSKQGVIP